MLALPGPQADESTVDIRDDVSKWVELVTQTAVPLTTLEALKHGFGIDTIGTMQTSIRTENDLEDFLHGILFQATGPLLHVTGTEGWEKDLVPDRIRITRWGSSMTRLWEDCHHAVRVSLR